MYDLLPETHEHTLSVIVDGRPVAVPAGASVAAALLLADAVPSRASAVSQAPRAPYCMMGVCFECLVEIDGIADRQACMVAAIDGMSIRRSTRLAGAGT